MALFPIVRTSALDGTDDPRAMPRTGCESLS